MEQALIISNIMHNKIIEKGITNACIPISIIFSNILNNRNITNKFNEGYINICGKYSIGHCWISIDGNIIDIAYDTMCNMNDPKYSTSDIVYSETPLYEGFPLTPEEIVINNKETEIKKIIVDKYINSSLNIHNFHKFVEDNYGIPNGIKELQKELYKIFKIKTNK